MMLWFLIPLILWVPREAPRWGWWTEVRIGLGLVHTFEVERLAAFTGRTIEYQEVRTLISKGAIIREKK